MKESIVDTNDVSLGYGEVRSVLGSDFVSPQEVSKFFPTINYTDNQCKALRQSLPSKETLEWCKENGYILIPAPPQAMTWLDVKKMYPLYFVSQTGGNYSSLSFCGENATSFGWIAIRKNSVPNSTTKKWDEQNQLLLANERVPSIAEISWCAVVYCKISNIQILKDFVYTSNLVAVDGNRIVLKFESGGIKINSYSDKHRYDCVGLSSALKL